MIKIYKRFQLCQFDAGTSFDFTLGRYNRCRILNKSLRVNNENHLCQNRSRTKSFIISVVSLKLNPKYF